MGCQNRKRERKKTGKSNQIKQTNNKIIQVSITPLKEKKGNLFLFSKKKKIRIGWAFYGGATQKERKKISRCGCVALVDITPTRSLCLVITVTVDEWMSTLSSFFSRNKQNFFFFFFSPATNCAERKSTVNDETREAFPSTHRPSRGEPTRQKYRKNKIKKKTFGFLNKKLWDLRK